MNKQILTTERPTVKRDDERIGIEIGNAVLAAVSGCHTAYVNRTWGEMKAAIDKLVSDHEPLASIEYGTSAYPTGYVVVERNEDGAVEVREMRP